MPSAPNYYSLVVGSNGYATRFPALPPTSTFRRMTISANVTNSGPISAGPAGVLQPGGTITVSCRDPSDHFLSGAPGDGCGIQY